MGDVVFSERNLLDFGIPEAIPIGRRSEIRANIANLPKSQILRTLNLHLIPIILPRTNLIRHILPLKHPLRIRPKFLQFIPLQFLLNLNILLIMARARIFVHFVIDP